MATLETFRPGPALDFSAITNPLRIARAEEIAQQRAAIDAEIRRGTLSVAEGNLAIKQLEAQTAATQTEQLGGLSGQLSNLTGGGAGVTPQVAPQGGLDAQLQEQILGTQTPSFDPTTAVTPQAGPPAPAQRRPARVLSADDIAKATKIFSRMERIKPGSSEGFRDVLEFGNDQQLEIAERERKKQRGRAFQLKGKPLDRQRRMLAQFRAEDEADGLDISEIEKMQRMDQDALGVEIDTDLFMDKNIDEALKIASKSKALGEVGERGTFTKTTPFVKVNPDGTQSILVPVTDSRTGDTTFKELKLDEGVLASKLGETPEAETIRQIKEKRLIARAKGEETQIRTTINDGITAAEGLGVIRRSIDLLKNIKTGGFEGATIRFKQFLGIEGADEAELSANLLRTVLAQLRPTFGAQFTNTEGERLERIEAGIGKSTAGNLRLLRQLEGMINREARRGLRAAKSIKDQFGIDEIQGLLKFKISAPAEEKDLDKLSIDQLLKR